MILNVQRWGSACRRGLVCIHGLTQHSGVFERLGRQLAGAGHSVTAVDLRGHGDSGFEPPWCQAAHVADLLETVAELGLDRVTWIGHSFGGRVAAAAAATAPDRTAGLVLLEPGLEVPPERALQAAETERLDWSFATVEGAVQAQLSSPLTVAAPREVVTAYVEDDLRKGPDGRFRFSFSPAAAVVAWSEMTLPPPAIVRTPTLLVLAEQSIVAKPHLSRYEDTLRDLLSLTTVPHGHNVLWESFEATIGGVERFLDAPGASHLESPGHA